jgi:hypothetical protein
MSGVWLAPLGSTGVDTSGGVSTAQAEALAARGMTYCIRALTVPGGHVTPKIVTPSEVAVIRGAGLALGFYQMFQTQVLSAGQGQVDGESAVSQLLALGCPSGVTVYGDSEGQSQTSADVEIAYWNAWGTAIAAGGYHAGLYVGPGPKMSGAQIGALSTIHGYWMAGAAAMPFPSPRGWQMFQLWPSNVIISGEAFDLGVTQQDFKGGQPAFWGPLPSPDRRSRDRKVAIPSGTLLRIRSAVEDRTSFERTNLRLERFDVRRKLTLNLFALRDRGDALLEIPLAPSERVVVEVVEVFERILDLAVCLVAGGFHVLHDHPLGGFERFRKFGLLFCHAR